MDINWLAVSAAMVFAFFIIKGYRKGFLRMAVTLAGTVAVMIATIVISPALSRSLINNPQIYGRIEKKLVETFQERLTEDSGEYKEENTPAVDDLDIPDIIKTGLLKDIGQQIYQEVIAEVILRYVAGYAAKLIIKSSAFVFVSAVLLIGLRLILKTTDLIARIPVIRGFNRLLGVAAGGGEALIIVWIFFLVIVMFLGNSLGSRLMADVNKSSFLSVLFNTNPFMKIIS